VSSGDALRTQVIEDVAALERLAGAWDELAAAAGCPGALSAWQLAWWRHLAPPGARLRAVAVHDGERLVGIAPWWVGAAPRGRAVYRLLAAPVTHRVEPLAEPARQREVAAAVARALAQADPAPDYVAFDGADAGGRWQDAIAGGWPGRAPWALTERTSPAPALALPSDGFEPWLAGKSRNFRQQMRRFPRKLAEAGGRVRMARTPEQLDADVEAFARLHHERWEGRGGSSLQGDVAGLLRDAGRALLGSERLRLWVVELEQRPVAAVVFLAAGESALYWNGGFDESAAAFKPALVGILAAIEDCFARGERELDLGGGAQDYKLRFADGDRPLAWTGLVPRNRRYLRNRAELLPLQASGLAREAFHRLPPERQERVRALRERLPGRA
jgi:CelD/BcsL family acetyltransferase involved in cellulose biosynthesis